jgi:flagellar hook-associated protein 2
MSGLISAGGLITGIDSNSLIQQLLQLDRQPAVRLETRVTTLRTQQTALREIRTQLQTLRNRSQDFRLDNVFSAFEANSSDSAIATATVAAANPVVGAFALNVTQLATATVATSSSKLGAAVNPAATLNASGIATDETAGTFSINGVQFNVDPATQSLNSILSAITGSSAGVTASYDALNDRVSLTNTTPGDTSVINLGATGDTSDFLARIAVSGATQSTGGGGSTVATSTRNIGAIDATEVLNAVSFANGAITAGSFSINGVSINVDPTQDTILDVIGEINGSDAGVDASYDTATDSIRIVSRTLGSRTIRFGGVGDTSNFLSVTNLTAATQTAGNDAQFTINGGPVQTRNTNEVSDAIGGITLRLQNTGTSTVTVATDNDTIIERVQSFIDEFNTATGRLREITATGAALASDGSVRNIESFLRSNIFNQVTGVGSSFQSLAEIGITTGQDFNSETPATLELDADAFLEALRDDPDNVKKLFSNTGGTGVADVLFSYLDSATASGGFLNERGKANGIIDQQITSINDSVRRIDERLAVKEARLRRQFTMLEQMSAGFQNQSNALSSLRSF